MQQQVLLERNKYYSSNTTQPFFDGMERMKELEKKKELELSQILELKNKEIENLKV